MKIEKKLILCSILAISIGIASVIPLAFFMSTAKAQTNNDVPWFNAEVPCAWFRAVSENSSTYIEGTGTLDTIRYETSCFIDLNYTLNPAAEDNLENARAEYFQLQIYSDIGQIANETTYFGANCGDNFDYMKSFAFSREDWFNSSGITGGGCFVTKFNGTMAERLAIGWTSGVGRCSGSSCWVNDMLPQEFLNAQNAQTIYIDVYRIGSIIFGANTTTVTLADNTAVIDHIELTRVGDRFIFGEVPADQMEIPVPSPL
ncbi:MAG: hypothetical protein NWF01_08840 [Candidatus Bathyarchaeota archaeon]|nr:hypothetical protein [Candidatus Bathyarchaeota archaeon]